MSVQEHVVRICPPEHEVPEERYHFGNYTCPSCNGRGCFTEETGRDEFKSVACRRCGGTGKVRAEVSVRWLPDEY